jgi:signal transduction histidine kinase
MIPLIAIAALILLSTVLVVRAGAYRKLKKQTQFIVLQSQEIKKQMEELEKQNELLNELNREKQQIISVVSHDLKGPFNRIFAIIQLMAISADNLNAEQKEYLGKIHQILADGLSMVRNLIDNHRFEDRGIDLMPEPVKLNSMMSPLISNYRTLAEKKKIEVKFTTPSKILLNTDKLYLTRVIDNLLSNALKFSSPGSTVFVDLHDSEEFASIVIRDQGPGISANDQKKLFQRYQRLSARPTDGESSTGLGLYIVKTIIDRMEGELTYESEEGKGTTFAIRLKKNLVE